LYSDFDVIVRFLLQSKTLCINSWVQYVIFCSKVKLKSVAFLGG